MTNLNYVSSKNNFTQWNKKETNKKAEQQVDK